jgi:2-iminobutanoate/2-iminopropanoate deaminase
MKINFKNIVFLVGTFCLVSTCFSLSASPNITQIITEQAPKAIGPYSQAIKAGSYTFVSGQIAIDPTTGKLIGETIEEQTRQLLKNIEAILAADGLTLENVIKTEVYLKDLKDFPVMNEIYAEKFAYAIKPARATIQVSKLPMDAMIEISCVAFNPDH